MPREAPERPFSGVFSLGQWFLWARVAACPRAAFLRLSGIVSEHGKRVRPNKGT